MENILTYIRTYESLIGLYVCNLGKVLRKIGSYSNNIVKDSLLLVRYL